MTMDEHHDYASYLLRFWRESESQAAGPSWQVELESIQTGDAWRFADFADLIAFFEDALTLTDQHEGKQTTGRHL